MTETIEHALVVTTAEGSQVQGPAEVKLKKAGRARAWRVFRLDRLGATTRLKVPFTHDAVSFEVVTRSYRDVRTGDVFVTAPQPQPLQIVLPRDLKRWQPRFLEYRDLPPTCGPLREILESSASVSLLRKRGQPRTEPLGSISDAGYDDLETHGDEATLAKAALLNLFWKMWRTPSPTAGGAPGRPWFAFLRRILLIGRERIVAEAESGLLRAVTRIATAGDPEYDRQPQDEALKHRANIQAAFDDGTVVEADPLVSIKSRESLGSLQLTVTSGRAPGGRNLTLLDADIDDHKGFRHVLDVIFKHPLTGGTDPLEIHEALALRFRTPNPAYQLVEKS